VHVWENGHSLEPVLATAHKPGVLTCLQRIERAFEEALGGRLRDLDTQVLVVEGTPQIRLSLLTDREDDLLVLGASIRPWWRPRLTPSVAPHCIRRARCPVLVVPPAETARGAASCRSFGHTDPSTLSRTEC
jgi:nucleotide-binding universal stress UspA family protein